MAWSDYLFYIIFGSQIFLLSYYLPNKLLARMQYVFAAYPPETYPKLYPRSVEHYRTAHRLFRFVSRLILMLGLLLLFAVVFWIDHRSFAADGHISVLWPAAYGIIQFLPLMAVEFSEFSNFRHMREANSASRRVADLRRRRITDLVSPALLGMTALLFLGAILFDLYAHDFTVSWGHDTVQRALVMAATNALLAVVGAFTLYGRKLDPHQSSVDRVQRMSVGLKSLLYISMALSVFIAITAADDIYPLDFASATILSIYFQVIALLSLGYVLRSIHPDEIDFGVYRKEAAGA